ncbi:hypothetical protein H4696_008026 [Amycolatopsis lexingtonensis]|uniref:Uncharacterized protein n=1 Tax=Amycolatopsis lexingtonensis TaxID=218822 RepID=A0ABR9ICM1_9PSEU|nr:hypothetical protein [Amycolatopsis lexingtonensis]MBE1500926.1 hypothetical protein [Amycolatopsis lexingtonensis]
MGYIDDHRPPEGWSTDTPEWFEEQATALLAKLLEHGAQVDCILRDAPEFVDIFVAPESHPNLSQPERALILERKLLAAMRRCAYRSRRYRGMDSVLFGLSGPSHVRRAPLKERKAAAARHCGIKPESFSRRHITACVQSIAVNFEQIERPSDYELSDPKLRKRRELEQARIYKGFERPV